jgi:pimeloyl-ACP methyl ester carboxylesterase
MHTRDEGRGEPLLLLHAFPLNGEMWRPQIEALAPHYRLLAPDLPGFGATPLPGAAYTLDDLADSLAALLDELAIEQVTLAGLSMGGYIAFSMLRYHPQRIRALVLADTRAGADNDQGKAGREANARLAEEQGAAAIADKLLPNLLSPNATPETVAHMRAIITANDPAGIAAALRAMAKRADSTDLLTSIAVPTLIVVGTQDTLTPPAEAHALHQAIAGSKLSEVYRAGHIANLEQPQAFNDLLLLFLRDR